MKISEGQPYPLEAEKSNLKMAKRLSRKYFLYFLQLTGEKQEVSHGLLALTPQSLQSKAKQRPNIGVTQNTWEKDVTIDMANVC